ncbi:MAG: hypothetical protein HC922_02215 [Leptolyngbyaceae cyanobacterium SM2_3_12]|nr:hypothetical protein [Leptolyngbyaceae cyanobacterium SM2_3_12]
MNTWKKAFQSYFSTAPLRSLLGLFLAGALLFFSTACGSTQAAAPIANPLAPPSSDNGSSNTVSQPGQDMYPHTDTQRDTTASDTKAERMVQQAKQRIQNNQGVSGYVDEITPDRTLDRQAKDLGRSVQRAAEDVGDSAQQAAENAADNTQKGFRNLKQNAQKAIDEASDALEEATGPG